MKKFNYSFVCIFLLVFLIACKKDKDLPAPPPKPIPGDTITARTFKLTFENIPAAPPISGLTAIVTVKNNQDELVFENKVFPIQYNVKYGTASITLTKGNFSISKLLIKRGDTVVVFASPVTGSAKASSVTKPLSLSFPLDQKTEKVVSVEVLPVSPADTPQSFGYPEGTFGNRPSDPETITDKKIFIKPLFKIGNVIYDSVPVLLKVRSYDKYGNVNYRQLSLPAGTQEIILAANAVRHELSILKWNTYDELVLKKEDVQENAVYTLGGNKEAKKLVNLFEFKMVNGASTPVTKATYTYDAGGELKDITVLGKRADNTNYVLRKELFEYQAGHIAGIKVYDENGSLSSSSSFGYDANGKVNRMEEIKGNDKTNGTVFYSALEGETGNSRDYRADIQYTYTHQYFTTNYSKTMHGGNVLTDILATSHGDRIEGMYEHDFNINPFIHLGIPDLFLTNISKHNVTTQWKTWINIFPEFEPIDFKYTYDVDGYPTELITKYRSYLTKQETHSIRTVFVY